MPVTRPADDPRPIPPDGGASADVPTASLAGIDSGLQRIFDAAADSRSQSQAPTQTNDAGPAEPAPAAPNIPGYTVLEHLGGGGMGDVWRVTDALDRELALKTIRVDRLTPTARDRFLAEAKAMSKVEHAHIAPIRHYQVHENTPYFLMDVYPTTLQKRLSEYQADPGKAVRLMIGVAEAVGAMHAKGYIHRDLKPGNVLIAADGTPRVSDLGLAKALADPPSEVEDGVAAPSAETRPVAQSRTMTGAVMGTRPYMAPEAAAGRVKDANPRWDVFALGVMLHELLTGHRPPSSDMPEVLLEDGQPDNPPPSVFNADLDPRLEQVIQTCLAKDQNRRYADGSAVAAALGTWLRTAAPAKLRAGPGRRGWRWLVAAGLTGAVVFALAMLWPRGRPGPSTEPSRAPETAEERLEKALAALVDRLGRGETVELVGETGPPAYYRVFGHRPESSPIEPSEVFTVGAHGTVMVELVPAWACPHGFEMTARIQVIEEHGMGSKAGLFGARDPALPAAGPDHVFLAWTFTEMSPLAGGGVYQLVGSHHVNMTEPRASAVGYQTRVHQTFPNRRPGLRQPFPERALGWTVSAKSAAPVWNGTAVGTVQIPSLNRAWQSEAPEPIRGTKFDAAGAAGLIVVEETVRVRSVTVRPLPPPDRQP